MHNKGKNITVIIILKNTPSTLNKVGRILVIIVLALNISEFFNIQSSIC